MGKNKPSRALERMKEASARAFSGSYVVDDVRSGFEYHVIPTNRIFPNPKNARKTFPQDELQELADSIRDLGQLQPVIVRREDKDGEIRFMLQSGERRWRACVLGKIPSMRAIVVKTNGSVHEAQISLVENLQREDLKPFELAMGVAAFKSTLGPKAEDQDVAAKLRKSKPWVSRLMTFSARITPKIEERLKTCNINDAYLLARAAAKLSEDKFLRFLDQMERIESGPGTGALARGEAGTLEPIPKEILRNLLASQSEETFIKTMETYLAGGITIDGLRRLRLGETAHSSLGRNETGTWSKKPIYGGHAYFRFSNKEPAIFQLTLDSSDRDTFQKTAEIVHEASRKGLPWLKEEIERLRRHEKEKKKELNARRKGEGKPRG